MIPIVIVWLVLLRIDSCYDNSFIPKKPQNIETHFTKSLFQWRERLRFRVFNPQNNGAIFL